MPMNKPTDIFSDIEAAAEEDAKNKTFDLGPLTPMIEKQKRLEAKPNTEEVDYLYNVFVERGSSISDVEEALKNLKKDLFRIKQNQIPEFMKGVGLKEVKTEDGFKLKIEDGISITVRDRLVLNAFIRSQNYGSIIKDAIIVELGEISPEELEQINNILETIDCSYERKESVHGQSLKKFIKDMMKAGIDIPKDSANVFEYQYSTIE